MTPARSMFAYISQRDQRLMRCVHRWPAPRWVRLWMICATRGGDGWLWYSLGFMLLVFGGGDRFRAVAAASLSSATGVLLFLWLKRWTRRRRPCALEPHCWANLLPPDHFSFPSGHTITAFAMMTSVCGYYPELFIGLLFCALSIAASRILLGMHFLSDVAAGAGIGALLGTAAVSLFR